MTAGTPPTPTYDALLFLSFGGPDKPEDVMPFLDNVLRGRNVPRERMIEVAENYFAYGGKSPINDQNRALIVALEAELNAYNIRLPIYWGNRNWHPLLADTMRKMAADGVRRAMVFITSAYSSYSGCRQYREDIEKAQGIVGPGAPVFDKLRHYALQPGFLEAMTERVQDALSQIPSERRAAAHMLFTAHSIPIAMAESSRYVQQLEIVAKHLANAVNHPEYRLVYQSRSGPPTQPWLEPDVKDALTEIATSNNSRDVIVTPIGFISDHMEVKVDLDTQAKGHAEKLGLNMVRAGTAGTHPRFVRMIRELIEERLAGNPNADGCLENCCPNPHRAGGPPTRQASAPTPSAP